MTEMARGTTGVRVQLRDPARQAYQILHFNLLLIPGYYDIALRDFGLSLGALALARLSEAPRAAAG
jgi:hypothetical protein